MTTSTDSGEVAFLAMGVICTPAKVSEKVRPRISPAVTDPARAAGRHIKQVRAAIAAAPPGSNSPASRSRRWECYPIARDARASTHALNPSSYAPPGSGSA